MFEPWSWLLSLIALGVAVYALILARAASRAQRIQSPLDQWEDEIAGLTAELSQAAQQAVAQLHARQEELQALLERAEQAALALSASGAAQAAEASATEEAPALEAAAAAETPSAAAATLDTQIRRLAAEGASAAEIARQTKLPQEEVILRLKRSA